MIRNSFLCVLFLFLAGCAGTGGKLSDQSQDVGAVGVGVTSWTAQTEAITGTDVVGITDVSDTTQSDNGSSKKATMTQIGTFMGTLFEPIKGTDDNFVTDAYLARLGNLEIGDDVSFGSVTATGIGGLSAGLQSSVKGALILYSNANPFTFGIMPADTPTGGVALKAPPDMPLVDNSLMNFDINGTGGWTDPASFGGGSMTWPTVAGIPYWTSGTAWGGAYTLDTDLSTVSASDDSIPTAKATDATYQKIADVVEATVGTGLTGAVAVGGENDGKYVISVTPDTYQLLDADLTAIAVLSCADGEIPKKASGVWTCSADTGGSFALDTYPVYEDSAHSSGFAVNGTTLAVYSATASKWLTASLVDTLDPTPVAPTAPTMIISGAGPQIATFSYAEAVNATTSPDELCEDWSISMTDAGTLTLGYTSGTTTPTIVCSITEDVFSGDTVASASYTQGTIQATDDATLMANIADFSSAITNSSSESAPVSNDLTMAITDTTGTGSTFTVDSIAATVADTPKTWTGLSSATEAVTFTPNTTETSSCTGTGVTGSDPNWVVDMSSADVTDMACTVSAGSGVTTDDFNRADESPMAPPWFVVGAYGTLNIVSGEVVSPTNTENAMYHNAARANDQYAQITTTNTSSTMAYGPGVRTATDAKTGYWFTRTGLTTASIDKKLEGTHTTLNGTCTATYAVGSVMRLEIVGNTLTAKVDGTEVCTATDSTSPISSGYASIKAYHDGGGFGRIDNFEAGDL